MQTTMAPKKKKLKKELPVDHRVVIHDGFDEMAFEGIQNYSRIEQICKAEKPEDTKIATDLVQDVFTSFYRTEALIDEEKKSLTKDIVQEFHNLKEFKDYHHTSMMNSTASALGSIQMSPMLLEKLREIRKQIEQQREQQRQKNKQDGKDENDGVPNGEPGLDELDGEGQSSLRQAMRQALDKASKENEETQAQMRQWGIEKGEIEKMDPTERLEFADRLKQAGTLQNVSQLMGRFKHIINATLATQPSHGHDEIVDIGAGAEIARMLPSEAMKFMHTPLLFYKDFAERNLMVYNMRGVENLGKGPLIVLWDRSGSMQGKRESWAVAFVLTLMSYAQQQGRAFAWIAFDSDVHDSEFFAKGESISLEEKMRVAEMGCSGGTDFWEPLQKCMELHGMEPELKPADAIFITDGECALSDEQQAEFAAWKKEKGVRVFGVGIADGSNYENADFSDLEAFADQICMVNDLGEVSALRQAVMLAHKQEDHQ